jgi:hypothetical protein
MASIDDFFDRYIKQKAFVSSSKVPDHRYKNAEYTYGKVYYLGEIDTNSLLPQEFRTITASMNLSREAALMDTRTLQRYYKDFNDLPFD